MINKKVLSEIAIYSGKIKMPEGFEIEKDELVKTYYFSQIIMKMLIIPFSKNLG
jgi:hypothetical protein